MREKILINKKWHFLGEVPEYAFVTSKAGSYLSAKTERLQWGAGHYRHVDMPGHWDLINELSAEKWKIVNLPHDYIVTQTPDPNQAMSLGFFKYHDAWYRKHFTVDEADRNKRITVYFEGVTGNSDIYLNGCFMHHSSSSYASFEVDITDIVRFGEDNVLAVYIKPDAQEGWWYPGGGIYRNVYLIKTAKCAVDLYGVFLPVEKLENNDNWKVPVEVETFNIDYQDKDFDILCEIFDPDGKFVTSMNFKGSTPAREKSIAKCETIIQNPALWDLDTPIRYTARISLSDADGVFDTYEQKFGFRTIKWCSKNGFYLNGRNIKLKGVCVHQDFGLTGKALPYNIAHYQMKLCKDMGANAFRAAHYMPHEAIMDACDTLGIMVMDENRRFESNEENLKHLEALIKRDRNRPSVIIWSTGNEEMVYHCLEQGHNIQLAMAHHIHKFDKTRPVTCAMTNIHQTTMQKVCEVIGSNYRMQHADMIHEQNPDTPYFSSENTAVPSVRGHYYGDCAESGLYDARDRFVNFLGEKGGRENTWKMIMERPWMAGGFQWTGIEYRGEAVWPRIGSISGAIDLFLQKKDAFYQNLSLWGEKPMIHLLPHWTHDGFEGKNINVWGYTNCEEAELFLNGKSLGRKKCEPYTHLEWDVVYVPGRIEIVGYNNGEKCASKYYETCSEAVKLVFELDTPELNANSQDVALVSCIAFDAENREVPLSGIEVDFSTSGAGHIVGTGSSNTDHVPVDSLSRKMFNGRISVGVICHESTEDTTFTLYASCPTLKNAVIEVKTKGCPEDKLMK